MTKIDEIALKLAHRKCTIYDHNHHIKYSFAEHHLIDFAHALLAELKKDAVPRAWIYYPKGACEKYVTYTNPASLDLGKQADRIAYIEPLFTSPPSTADIEQRVAEAIVKMIVDEYVAETDYAIGVVHVIKAKVRHGKWREYL